MKEKTIEIEGKSYTVKELKYKDVAAVADLDKSEVAKSLLVKSTGITDEEYDEMGMKTGISLMKEVNALNGLDEQDFQTATQIKD